MSVPKPESSLTGHCAAIEKDTLYVFNADAFQSLPLKENATWSQEITGIPVQDPACVKATSNGGASLYVVGGATDNSFYMGLQRYSFDGGAWETLTPLADVMRSRTNHSVAYLKDSDSILVYGGSTPDAPSLLSSQTFLISTTLPYNIRSFTSNAPPANNPILQPWNSSHAVMVGGETTNTGVWLFGPNDGWTQLGTNLSEPLDSAARAVVIDGEDGSKVLQVYDFQTSPNTAQGVVLLGPGGEVAAPGTTVGDSNSSRKRKGDLSINNWPSYNSTNAPTSTRTDCSISRNAQGTIVMAGGNDNDPIAMYDQNENSWIDAGDFFNRQVQQPLQPSKTASTSPTSAESSVSATSSEAAKGGGGSHEKTMRTLGITLGVLCGIAALFIIVLLFLRWRKMKAKKKNGGYLEEKDGQQNPDRMSFADRGASFMKEAGLSTDELAPPNRNLYNSSPGSHSSLAIIAGKIGNKRGTNGFQAHAAKGSFESTTHLVRDKDGNLVHAENHEMMDIGDKSATLASSTLTVPGAVHGSSLDKETLTHRKRSSGWSKYFATSAPTGPNGTSHIPSVYVKPSQSTLSMGSEYSVDRAPSQVSRIPSSVLVPPLDIDFNKTVDGQRLSHVTQGSPAFFDSREDFARGGSLDVQGEGQRGIIVDSNDPRTSQATSIGSSWGNRSTIDSTTTSEFYNESHTPWTPMSGQDAPRGTSSVYTNSIYDAGRRVPSRGKSAGFFPGSGTNFKPSKVKLSHAAGPTSQWASPQPDAQTADMDWAKPPKMPAAKAEAATSNDRDSTMTVFPGADYLDDKDDGAQAKTAQAIAGAQKPSQRQSYGRRHSTRQSRQSQPAVNTDMSWLDLGSKS
ncbi:hypothetical protein CLAFUW4_00484 [Fulvia fulva]|uniref:Pre-mRNA splicing factor CLF1 n=1 Tax=Passalora fulva TaxID=5499 RepID=A0A9Q8L8I0_PASFU|nr:uncharacterized protein CLAFUR5_00484 [Fulvia fulva]KAK4635998.1 hypothetical protein CLAFUR4_00484 [Fulvia fulva]KAK4638244.1 hypothetical protein CLAFUR0_00485 [Fulvia fulva]UJO12143.1 hypothetical protein CLAFUR5_00484 [Fulvia fulva]WPV08474.1 hypothetical protein CLAFUW4_00484 [Fulvia fulva]WPV24339.1 hypothetical protein CLAFUW7_00488 [Fulvia fulva]